MIIFTWIILAYGLSQILVYGSIFDTQRQWIHAWAELSPILKFVSGLISCMMCTSTWVGFAYGLGFWSPTNQLFEVTPYLSWFLDGMLASGGVWITNSIVEWFEENRPQKPNIV
jgi:hypothetical protein